ncbi:MAG: heparinase II/III family protein [Puniceicoccales bacterium]|jgi:hypothetical protein|nr:heparinase II/III family protein [Puniceicoccales bacterium]
MACSPLKYWQIVRALGWRWAVFRLRYAWRVRSGGLRRATPCVPWGDIPGEFDDPATATRWVTQWIRPELPAAAVLAEARGVLDGEFVLFGFHHCQAGHFPDWHRSPLDGAIAPAERHWSRISDFGYGDIKNIWELSRWPWAFTLARAWHVSRDDRFAARFWELLEDWMDKNPPNRGPNWKCGQETAFRLFAAVFARAMLDDAPSTTPARQAQWRRLVRASGMRIAANLDYALSQANNHGVSECTGLLTAGALVGGDVGRRWFARGERELEKQLAALVYADGGFSQHSAVYHRVLLHDLLWAAAVWRLEGLPMPDWLRNAGARATRFLAALVDADSGRAHLYGANDGSNVLPAAGCDYADFRPAVKAGADVFCDGEEVVPGELSIHFPDAGVRLWRRGGLSVLLRCPEHFRHRPSHADLLHLSALWRGEPVLLDPGSFSYNTKGVFAGGFAGAFVHNTATPDGVEQMERFNRFLFLPWPHGSAHEADGGAFEAAHFSWRKRLGAVHTRRVTVREDGLGFCVEDSFTAAAPQRWRLHWLLADGELKHSADGVELRLQKGRCVIRWECVTALAVSTVRADAASVRGWHAPHYQDAQPAHSLALVSEPMTQTRVRTVFSFE